MISTCAGTFINAQDTMDVISHHNKFIQHNKWKMVGDLHPILMGDGTNGDGDRYWVCCSARGCAVMDGAGMISPK